MQENFIHSIVKQDVEEGLSHVQTRFPPEPNGYLHVGHIKAIHLNFSIAEEFGGACNLRMDDTNPEKETQEYIDAICEDISWLGYAWEGEVKYASNYFEQLYAYATTLIQKKLAYVDELSFDAIRKSRGTPTEKGTDSPWRNRPIEENERLFSEMRAGKHPEGKYVLRAKIDMASDNITMRDPLLYRIRFVEHPRTLDKWCVYPLYDFAHCLSDAIEGITHSLCTLEFENHRPLYNWIVEQCECATKPRQIEFAKLNISGTVMSKRKLNSLVKEGHVSGWDDPRLPTIVALRRRGYPVEGLRSFVESVGLTKHESVVDARKLDYFIRELLNSIAQRRMVVADPIELVLENVPDDFSDSFLVENNPESPDTGTRESHITKKLFIERSDFMIDPPKKFFRMRVGGMVRLKYAYCVTCTRYETDETGSVRRVFCDVDLETRGGDSKGKKVRGTLHWVSQDNCVDVVLNEFEPLFGDKDISTYDDLGKAVNKDSWNRRLGKAERSVASDDDSAGYQFLRLGYFKRDGTEKDGRPVFNRIVSLKDSWKKIQEKSQMPSDK